MASKDFGALASFADDAEFDEVDLIDDFDSMTTTVLLVLDVEFESSDDEEVFVDATSLTPYFVVLAFGRRRLDMLRTVDVSPVL
jgi:hypothetical protein